MRWNLKRTKLLFALIPIISIVFYVLTANHSLYAEQSFAPFDIYQQISDTMSPEAGKDTPDYYTAAENFAIAAGVYLNTPQVQSATNGTVVAMGFYKQTVKNFKTKINGEIFNESISLSAIASVAEQRYFKQGAVLHRAGETAGNTVRGWSSTVTELSPTVYRQRYGVVPNEITKYSVTHDTVLSGHFVSANNDGTYTYRLILDPEAAQKYARYEMMTYAGVTSFPEFMTCELTYTVDSDWRIQTIEMYDVYKVALMGGAKCESRLTETFSYDNITMPERTEIFQKYEIKGVTGDIGGKKGPADYLQEAYGDYISGAKKLNLTANVKLSEEIIPLSASIDIAAGDYRFGLGSDIFAAYTGNTLYVKLGENKYKVTLREITALGKTFGLDLGELKFGDDILATLFANHTLTETDTHVHIVMPFRLMGIDFNVDMGLKKEPDGSTAADTINATITVNGVKVQADVTVADAVSLPSLIEDEYVSLTPALQAVQNTLTQKAYGLRGNLTVTVPSRKQDNETNENTPDATSENSEEPLRKDGRISVDIDARIVKTETGADAEGTLTIAGIPVWFAYTKNTLYLKAGSIGIRVNPEEIDDVINNIAFLLPQDTVSPSSGIRKQVLTVLSQILPGKPNVNTLLSLLTQLSYSDGALNLAVQPTDGTPWHLTLTHGQTLETLTLSGLSVAGIGIDASLTLGTGSTEPVTADGEYADAAKLSAALPVVKEFIDAQAYRVTLGGTVTVKGKTVDLNGSTVSLRRNPLALCADLTVNGANIGLIYANKTIYLTAGAFAAQISADDVAQILQQCNIDLSDPVGALLNLIGTSLPQFDLNALLQNFGIATKNGTIALTFSMDGFSVTATVKANKTFLVTVNGTVKGVTVNVRADAAADATENPDPIKPDDTRDYTDLGVLANWITPVRNTLASKTFGFTLTLDLHKDGLTEHIPVTVSVQTQNGLALVGSAKVSGAAIDFIYKDGTVYLRTGNVAVRLKTTQLPDLLESLTPLLGDAGTFIINNASLLGVDPAAVLPVLQKATYLLAQLPSMQNGELSVGTLLENLSFALPSLDFASVTDLLAKLTPENEKIVLPVTTAKNTKYTVTVTHNGTYLSGLTVKGLALGTLTADLTVAEIACNTGFTIESVSFNPDSYLDVTAIREFVPALRTLLTAKAYKLSVTEGELRSSLIAGVVSGTVEIVPSPLTVRAELTFRTHTVEALYTGNTVYIAVNGNNAMGGIKLTATTEEIAAFVTEIETLLDSGAEVAPLPAAVYQTAKTVGLIESMLGGTLDNLLAHIDELKAVENGLRIGLHEKELSLTADVLQAQGTLCIDLTNLNYGSMLEGSLKATLAPIDAVNTTVANKDSYVRLFDLQSYIKPVINTFKQSYYHLSFEGDVQNENTDRTTINGALTVIPTSTFIDAHLRLTLDGDKTGAQTIELYVIDDGSTDHTGVTGYLVYTGTIAKAGICVAIDYNSALRILGAVCDILNLNIPVLDDVLEGVYTSGDTSVFETMNIAGLDKIRDTVNKLFGTVDGVTDAANAGGVWSLLGFVTDDVLDKALSGVSVGIDETGRLVVRINNGIFDSLKDKQYAAVTVGHNNDYLSYVDIANLIANEDVVNFNARLTCLSGEIPQENKITRPTPNVKGNYDFSQIDELLSAVIDTAALREFEIAGNVHMSLFNKDIALKALVKILDDGTTAAAVKMNIPYAGVNLGFINYTVTKTDSYIYFVNDMLYFVVDVYSRSWGSDVYSHTEIFSATVEEFLADPTRYLFKCIRFSDDITGLFSSGGGGGSTDLNDILKGYAYDNGIYTLTVGLGELAGTSALKDLVVKLVTVDGYVTGINIETSLAGIINITTPGNISVVNLIDANGKPHKDDAGLVYTTPTSSVDFGRDEKKLQSGKTFTLNGLGLMPSESNHLAVADLEDHLAKLFSVEAAHSFADKAADKAERANQAAQKAADAIKRVSVCEKTLANAVTEYGLLKAKLDRAQENTFGYEQLKAQVDYALVMKTRAADALTQAKTERTVTANNAIAAATDAFNYADKAASVGKAVLTDGSADAYTAAAAASQSAVDALYAVQTALDEAIASADSVLTNEKADEGEKAQAATVKQTAQKQKTQIQTMQTAVAQTAVETAVAVCADRVTVTAQTAAQTEAARASGDWFTAADKAAETLDAINALKKAAGAATRGALLTQNETTQSTAQTAADKAALSITENASVAAKAAIDAATAIATAGRTLADQATADANAGGTDSALDKTEQTLVYASKALFAAQGASKAAQLSDDADLTAKAENAADKAESASHYVGNAALAAAQQVALTYRQIFTADKGSAHTDVRYVTENLTKALRLNVFATDAARYATEIAVSPSVVYRLTAQSAATVLGNYGETLFNLAVAFRDGELSAAEKGVDAEYKIKWVPNTINDTAGKMANAAQAMKTAADNTANFAKEIIALLEQANIALIKGQPFLTQAEQSALVQSLTIALGGDGTTGALSGLRGAYAVLQTCRNDEKTYAQRMSDKIESTLNVAGGSTVYPNIKTAKNNAAAAIESAAVADETVTQINAPLGALASLLSHINTTL